MSDSIITSSLPTGKNHISYSEYSDWARCSWKHRLKHVKKLGADDESPYLVFGSIVHDCCENILKSGSYNKDELVSFLEKNWLHDHPKFVDWKIDKAIQEATDILNEVPAFLAKQFPNWSLFGAETYLYEPLDNHPDVSFKGYVDCIISVPNKSGDNTLWVLDWKTSNRGWFSEKRRDAILLGQVILYRNILSKKHNFVERDAKCGYVVLNRSGKPGAKCDLVTVSAGPITINKTLKVLNNSIASLKRGIAIKNKGDACKYCEFKETIHCP